MPNNNSGRSDSIAAFYGFNRYTRIADLSSSNHKPVKALDAVSVNGKSTAQTMNARGIEIELVYSAGATCTHDLKVYRVDSGPVDTLVKTFTGLGAFKQNSALFVGLAEDVDLKGLQVKVEIVNYAGSGTITANLRSTQ